MSKNRGNERVCGAYICLLSRRLLSLFQNLYSKEHTASYTLRVKTTYAVSQSMILEKYKESKTKIGRMREK